MLRKKFPWAIFLTAAVLLSGCGNSEKMQTVEGLDALGSVQVVSREEGSGTRSSFADLVGFAKTDSDDATTDKALIVSDTNSVAAEVENNKSAIGYVSMGTDLPESVKMLAVNGTNASKENVSSGDYVLSRPLCLVWAGKLSETEQDFMTYVMGKGQAIVKNSYSNVHNSTDFLSNMSSGTITIHGSTSVANLMEELAEEYMSINTNAVIEVTVSDSTAGINDALQGSCDIGMVSRELKDYEKELLDYEVIAYDGIAVIVNSQNPLENINTDELKLLFTGETENWKDIKQS